MVNAKGASAHWDSWYMAKKFSMAQDWIKNLCSKNKEVRGEGVPLFDSSRGLEPSLGVPIYEDGITDYGKTLHD